MNVHHAAANVVCNIAKLPFSKKRFITAHPFNSEVKYKPNETGLMENLYKLSSTVCMLRENLLHLFLRLFSCYSLTLRSAWEQLFH